MFKLTVSIIRIADYLPQFFRDTNYNFTRGCNADCSCDGANLFPVCDKNGYAFYSPCHAGCREVKNNNNWNMVLIIATLLLCFYFETPVERACRREQFSSREKGNSIGREESGETTREVRDAQTEAEAPQVDVQLNWEREGNGGKKRNAKAPHAHSTPPPPRTFHLESLLYGCLSL